jgi:hypothetical protein
VRLDRLRELEEYRSLLALLDHQGLLTGAEIVPAAPAEGSARGIGNIAKQLLELTGGEQELGLDQRFWGDSFVAGLYPWVPGEVIE